MSAGSKRGRESTAPEPSAHKPRNQRPRSAEAPPDIPDLMVNLNGDADQAPVVLMNPPVLLRISIPPTSPQGAAAQGAPPAPRAATPTAATPAVALIFNPVPALAPSTPPRVAGSRSAFTPPPMGGR